MMDTDKISAPRPPSHPRAALIILGCVVILSTTLLVTKYLSEWPFIVLLSFGLAAALIAFLGGDIRMFKAGPSGVEVQRDAQIAVNARNEAAQLAMVAARIAAFNAVGDPGYTRHGPREKLRIAWLETTLQDLRKLSSDDAEADKLLQLLREFESCFIDITYAAKGNSHETCKAYDDQLACHTRKHNELTKRYIDILEARTGRTDLAEAAREDITPYQPKYRPRKEETS